MTVNKFLLTILLIILFALLIGGIYFWIEIRPNNQLYDAACEGDVTKVQSLVDSGLDPSVATMYGGWSPLHGAAHMNEIHTAKLLLKLGADIEAKSDRGITPLWTAVRSWHEKVALCLIAAGANVNATVKNDRDGVVGSTPLHFAVEEQEKVVEHLLKNGADLSIQDANGQTPLHRAIDRGVTNKIEIIQMLLDAGADVNLKDKLGKSAIDYIHPNNSKLKKLITDWIQKQSK